MQGCVVFCIRRYGWHGLDSHIEASHRRYCERHGYAYHSSSRRYASNEAGLPELAPLLGQARAVLVVDSHSEFADGFPPLAALGAERYGILYGYTGDARQDGIYLFRPRRSQVFRDVVQQFITNTERMQSAEGPRQLADFLQNSRSFRRLPAGLMSEAVAAPPQAVLRRFRGPLREAAETDAVLRQLSRPLPPRDAEDHARRLQAMTLAAATKPIRAQFAAGAEPAARFRDAVAAEAASRGIVLPRLVLDDADAWLWRMRFLHGMLEPATLEVVLRILQPGQWFVDGGAHLGYFGLMLGRHLGLRDKVFGVEAHPENVAGLRANLPQATIVHAALGCFPRRDGPPPSVTLFDGHGHSNSSLFSGVSRNGVSFEVPARNLDQLLAEAGVRGISVFKLDVEGFELDALKGARRALRDNPGIALVLEINPRLLTRAGRKAEEILAFLARLGHQGRRIDEDFHLGPVGHLDLRRTANYLFARPERWAVMETQLFGPAAPPA